MEYYELMDKSGNKVLPGKSMKSTFSKQQLTIPYSIITSDLSH